MKMMKTYRLYALFQLTDKNGKKEYDAINCITECDSKANADLLLEMKVSEKLSEFSKTGLNWRILEKNAKSEKRKPGYKYDHIEPRLSV